MLCQVKIILTYVLVCAGVYIPNKWGVAMQYNIKEMFKIKSREPNDKIAILSLCLPGEVTKEIIVSSMVDAVIICGDIYYEKTIGKKHFVRTQDIEYMYKMFLPMPVSMLGEQISLLFSMHPTSMDMYYSFINERILTAYSKLDTKGQNV